MIQLTEQEYLLLKEHVRDIEDSLRSFITYMHSSHMQVPIGNVVSSFSRAILANALLATKQDQLTETPGDTEAPKDETDVQEQRTLDIRGKNRKRKN